MAAQEQKSTFLSRDTERSQAADPQLLLPFHESSTLHISSSLSNRPFRVPRKEEAQLASEHSGMLESKMKQGSDSEEGEVMVAEPGTYDNPSTHRPSTRQIIRITEDAKGGEPEYTFVYDKLQEADVFQYCFDLDYQPEYPSASLDEYTLDYSETGLAHANEEEVLGVVFKIADEGKVAEKIRAWYDWRGVYACGIGCDEG